MMEIPKIFKKY